MEQEINQQQFNQPEQKEIIQKQPRQKINILLP